MVIWGTFWGLFLGSLWPEAGGEFGAMLGAVLGAFAGWTLRGAVRREVKAQHAKLAAGTPGSAPAGASTSPVASTMASEAAAAAAPPAWVQPTAARDAATPSVSGTPAEAEALAAAASGDAAMSREGAAQSPDPTSAPTPHSASTPPLAQQETLAAGPDPVTALAQRARQWLFGGNTIVRLGVLILFVGLAFLAKYAVDNALLPPELRLAGIAAAGIALFVGGVRLRRQGADKLAFSLTLQGAGVAVLYLTVFAAFRLYQFLPPMAAFALLAMVCAFSTIIALVQNAPAMAFIGFAGAFAAPLLVSTGSDNATGLFSYYLLLGVAIAAIAWLRAWRALNLLGFFATFGVATLWGVLKYRPEAFAGTEPFLIAFFAVYLLASLLYALRHSLGPKQAVDATLIFGTPLVAFGLQMALVRHMPYAGAFSSLALGALYLALATWLLKRQPRGGGNQPEVSRWLAECFLALGLGFVTLAVPLALDARWTSAVWAAEGAGVYWMGRRQDRTLARVAGLALQGIAAVAYLGDVGRGPDAPLPFANPAFLGALLLAGSALAIARWARPPAECKAPAQGFKLLEQQLSPLLFWVAFLWWQLALGQEITRAPLDAEGAPRHVVDGALRLHLMLLAWLGSSWAAWQLFASPRRARPWPIAATPAWLNLPWMLVAALMGMDALRHVFEQGGWLCWPLALLLHGTLLRKLDAGPPQRWWPWVHAGGVWLMVLLGGNLLVFAVGRAELWHTAWASVILLVSGIAVLLLLSRRAAFPGDGHEGATRWPLNPFARAYLWTAAFPLAVVVALGCLVVAVHSDGNAHPLPYVPLLNPTDLTVALGLLACAQWLQRVRASSLALPAWTRHTRAFAPLGFIAFIAINTVWLRVAHHFAGVPWDPSTLFDSFLVQAGYSILWTLLALGLMVLAHRRVQRGLWMLGASLLGATVLKLLLIDLSNRGGGERIVVFIAVGALMLVVGYFAPLPPAAKAVTPDTPLPDAEGKQP